MINDTDYMRRCFTLAELGRHGVGPNPTVGCVLARDGQVVAEGWTQPPGQAHAEVHALRQAGSKALGATAYVSLEPCAHHGRTGPCAVALVEAGVKRVVYGMEDPNPNVAGRGLQILRAAGVVVEGPLLESEARAINPGFNKRMREGMPLVRMKLAMSLDGRVAMANGESQWITGPSAREDVQGLRARSHAILTGIGTVLKDDPSLNVRIPGFRGKQPLRVIADTNGRLPAQARVLQLEGRVLQASAVKTAQPKGRDIKASLTNQVFPGKDGRLNLHTLVSALARDFECNEVLVEAGPILSGAMLQAGLVDELILYIAPSLLGHEGLPMAVLPGLEHLSERLCFRTVEVAMLGKDCRIRTLPER